MAGCSPRPPGLSPGVAPRLCQDGQLSLPGECLRERRANILPATGEETELTRLEEDKYSPRRFSSSTEPEISQSVPGSDQQPQHLPRHLRPVGHTADVL